MDGQGDVAGCSGVLEPARRLQDLMDRMLAEYGDGLAAGSIVRCVARCTRVAYGLRLDDAEDVVWVVENLARHRLDARLRADEPVPAPVDPCDVDLMADVRLPLPSLTP